MASTYGRPPLSASKQQGQSHSGSPIRYAKSYPTIGSTLSTSSSFQMMNLSISIDIMEGLTMECNRCRGEPPLGSMPVNAFISCMKNVSKSRQIATHVPSLPLSIPAANFGDKTHNFLVRWPADFDPQGDALSTFKLSRLMKKDSYYSDYDTAGSNHSAGYVPEEVELSIGLMRGSEMIKLGKATLIISGNETSELLIDLPVMQDADTPTSKKRDASPSPAKRSSPKRFGRRKDGQGALKPRSFPSDPRRKYFFSEHSMIRLQVHIVPEHGEEAPAAKPPSSFDDHEVVKDNLHIQQPDPSKTASMTSSGSASRSRENGYASHSHPPDLSGASSYSMSTDDISANVDSSDFVSLTSTLYSKSEEEYHYDHQNHHHHYNSSRHTKNYQVPMDEMQHDMVRMRVKSDRRPMTPRQHSHGSYHPHQPQHRQHTTQPTHSGSNGRSSSRSRGYVQDAQDYGVQQQSSAKASRSNSRAPSRSRGHRTFGQEMPSLTQQSSTPKSRHSTPMKTRSSTTKTRSSTPVRTRSSTPMRTRSSTPMKSRESASSGYMYSPQTTQRSGSRSKPRDPDQYHGVKQSGYNDMNYMHHHERHIPHVSSHLDKYEHYDDESENVQFYGNGHHDDRVKHRRLRATKGSSESTPRSYLSFEQRDEDGENRQYHANERRSSEKTSHRKKRETKVTSSDSYMSTDQVPKSTSDESPMSWIYDKLVGKGQSHDETVVKNNKSKSSSSSSKKKGSSRTISEDGHPYRTPTPKRTMKV